VLVKRLLAREGHWSLRSCRFSVCEGTNPWHDVVLEDIMRWRGLPAKVEQTMSAGAFCLSIEMTSAESTAVAV
jgi:hypothetical protein